MDNEFVEAFAQYDSDERFRSSVDSEVLRGGGKTQIALIGEEDVSTTLIGEEDVSTTDYVDYESSQTSFEVQTLIDNRPNTSDYDWERPIYV